MRLIAVVLLALLLAGCSHGSAASTGTVTAPASTSSTTHNATTSSPRSNAWTSLVSLRQLGRFSTRCGPSTRFSTLYRADPQTADEEVSVLVNGRGALKRTLHPGQTWNGSPLPDLEDRSGDRTGNDHSHRADCPDAMSVRRSPDVRQVRHNPLQLGVLDIVALWL